MPIAPLFTRKDYMATSREDQPAAHRRYYGQFATDSVKKLVCTHIGTSRIIASTDPHFNDIPLEEWDHLARTHQSSLMVQEEEGGKRFWCLSGAVCILKEAARQIKEGE